MFLLIILLVMSLTYFVHSEGVIFDETSDFLRVSKTKGFVDKTLLIKSVFHAGRRFLLTAPRKFGKSTNLNMIKQFLSMQSMKNQQTRDIYTELKIHGNDEQFFNNNFGKWPVLFVDLKMEGNITGFDEVIEGVKFATHKSYLEHPYLKVSNQLDEDSRLICKLWSGDISFKHMTLYDIKLGLKNLGIYLNRHFSKSIVLLVDEYDCVTNDALFLVENNLAYELIVRYIRSFLWSILKRSSGIDVNVAVITGVSYISSIELPDINNLEKYHFLDNHPFVGFYGLTEDEVRKLFQKDVFKSMSSKSELAKLWYDGYACKEGAHKFSHVYNPYSFLQFLQTGKIMLHGNKSDYISSIFNMFQHVEIQTNVASLLHGSSIKLPIYNKLSVTDVFNLKDAFLQSDNTSSPNVDLLLTHLLEIGFLTHSKNVIESDEYYDDVVQTQVKIPNREVYNIMFTEFKNYYIQKYNLPRSLWEASFPNFLRGLIEFSKGAAGNCIPANVREMAEKIITNQF